MNQILEKIKQLMKENKRKYLPEVQDSDLEENGNIYYMNGKNGTEFDWYVNDKLSDFMMFYDDEDNLGAMKLTLYHDGTVLIYVYGERGQKIVQEIKTQCEVKDEELLNLAVLLRNEADDKRIFDSGLDKIESDVSVTSSMIEEFKNNEKAYDMIRNRKKLFQLRAYVSKKVTDEGWKIGYMVQNESLREGDSGWQFLAGNEDDAYLMDPKNIVLLSIGQVCQIDGDILKYLEHPTATEYIRISSHEFEEDNHSREIYLEKR